MSGLPWVRLDANIGTHDKLAPLQLTPDGRSAFVLYVCALGWAGGHGTDGHIPKHVISFVAPGLPKKPKLAQQLVEAGLWEYVDGGWMIVNFLERQQSSAVTEVKRENYSERGKKAACVRWHGPECGCWQASDDASIEASYERTNVLTKMHKDYQPIVKLRYAREEGRG